MRQQSVMILGDRAYHRRTDGWPIIETSALDNGRRWIGVQVVLNSHVLTHSWVIRQENTVAEGVGDKTSSDRDDESVIGRVRVERSELGLRQNRV
jgi:hypothetical protein